MKIIMEQKIIERANDTFRKYKDFVLSEMKSGKPLSEIMSSIQDTSHSLDMSDMMKKKRTKNVVPMDDRCTAKCADNEQCTRKKKAGGDVCGTHRKGIPHGVITEPHPVSLKKLEVWTQDINGIMYYIDANENIYKTEDVLKNKTNPSIYAKWKKEGDVYSIVL
jgi:hypothetical protein